MALLASDIYVSRQQRSVLAGVSLSVPLGKVVGVLGANGAGKSTLLGALSGEIAIQAGEVTLDQAHLHDLGTREQSRYRAVLPQYTAMSFPMDVATVVAMGAYPFTDVSPSQVVDAVADTLKQVGLQEAAERSCMRLSGGEQQRVQFARTLVQIQFAIEAKDHAYLLLDEPVSSLDPRHQQALLQTAQGLAKTARVGVLAVLHDLNLAAAWCDELVLLHDGRVLAAGEPQHVLTPVFLEQAYGVRPAVVAHPLDSTRPLVLFGR